MGIVNPAAVCDLRIMVRTMIDINFNPHDFPCVGFPERHIILSNKPLSFWKSIMQPISPKNRRKYFLWKFREFCEFENIPKIILGGDNMFWYLRQLIKARLQGVDGDGV